jgi:hypothetical protein
MSGGPKAPAKGVVFNTKVIAHDRRSRGAGNRSLLAIYVA